MTLYMVQMAPDLRRLTRWSEAQGLLPARGDADQGYVLHAVLAGAFGGMAPKPFSLQHHPRRGATLLGYTTQPGLVLREHAAAFAAPEVFALLALDRLADKAMPERFIPGTRLGFGLRARPMVRADRDGDRERSVEKDAFLLSPEQSDRGEVYAEWLGRHMEAGGARLVSVVLDGFQLTRIQRRGSDRGFHQLRGPDAVFSGVLEVTDSDAFTGLLARGVGRHRAFGFGMLLLRPA